MTDGITMKALAIEMQTSIDRLIQDFTNVGIKKTAVDLVTKQEKSTLMTYLNRNQYNRNTQNKLTFQRKTRSTLNIPSAIGGKSKSVQIEVRKKRVYVQQMAIKDKEVGQVQVHKNETTPEIKNILVEKKLCTHKKTNPVLTKSPKEVAEKAIREAKAAELRRKAEEETRRKVEEQARKVEEEARRMAEENGDNWGTPIRSSLEEDTTPPDYHGPLSHHIREAEDENDRKGEVGRRNRIRLSHKGTKQKKYNRLCEEYKAEREETRGRSVIKKRKNIKDSRSSIIMHGFNKPTQSVNRDVIIGETISIAELANKMAVKGPQVIKAMMKLGMMVTINQIIDQNTAQLVAEEMGHKVILRRENALEESVLSDRDRDTTLAEPRTPIVTIMGHVDHGKTSLLDYIRSTKVAEKESGGITQHIGAYHVLTHSGMITFIDTPGHAAFTAMRARGANATDIVVLVVAADDGVMPQTIEAIQHAKAAKVPIIVAINKIDKLESDIERVKHELSKHGVISEEWGGETQFVAVSATSGKGVNHLLDAILLQAEMIELKAVCNSMAIGVVIESFLDRGRGPIASILVREGTLHRGDIVLCGLEYGRIRAIRDEVGIEVSSAGPSMPVEILGLSGMPVAGDQLTVVREEKKAREVALYRQEKFREIQLSRKKKTQMENVLSNLTEGELSVIRIVLKSDVQGSAEAISHTLEQLSNKEVNVKIILSGVGGINENDATLAAASNAMLIGFNVRADSSARRIIDIENIVFRYYSVIYDLINDVQQAMHGVLTPEYKQKIIGLAQVRDVFRSLKLGKIAGCMVTSGVIKRQKKIHIVRENRVIYEGELESLRRFKEDVNEVRSGTECGIVVKNYNDIHVGDIIEVFENVEVQRTL